MAENKKSFIFYNNWRDTFKALPKDKGYDLLMHILSYVDDEEPKTDDVLINAVFANIKSQLKRDLVKYNHYVDKQRLNGKKGGRPSKAKETQITQPFISKPKKAVNVNDNDNDNVSVTVNDISNKLDNVIPTYLEFESYALSKKIVNKNDLKLKYDAWVENGWKDGHDNKIKNWKSKLLNTLRYFDAIKEKGKLDVDKKRPQESSNNLIIE